MSIDLTSSSYSSRQRLGDYLILKGVISESELDVALCEQKRHHRLLGDILLELGFVKSDIFYPILAEFLHYPYVDLSKWTINPDCLTLLPQDKGLKLTALVFHKQDNRLFVAMADPENIFIKDQLRQLLDSTFGLEFYLAAPREIFALYQGQVSSEIKPIQAGVEPLLQTILSEAVFKNASDVHFVPESKLMQLYNRVDGLLQKHQTLHADIWQRLLVYLKLIAKLDISETRNSQDGRFDFLINGEQIDCRISVVPTMNGESVAIRILRKSKGVLEIQHLGFTQDQLAILRRLTQQPQGLFLIAGPTGSGKTTTLYSLLNEIDWTSRNVVTVEDPVEYTMPGIRQSEVQPGGMQISGALRALLRHDPDVIYVSEIRDQETAHLAIQAALTGHLVLATLHANDVQSIPLRLKELGVDPLSLSSTLVGMMSQRLVRRYCVFCQGMKCENCGRSGYQGRIVIGEIEWVEAPLRRLLSQTLDYHMREEWVKYRYGETLRDQANVLVAANVTSIAEVARVLGDHNVATF
jgi:type II secretory ATPase GspE/PulE/Tfp pilus assembly ATPase PilB-like protein